MDIGFWAAVVTVVTIGCVTGIITTAIDKLASNKRRGWNSSLKPSGNTRPSPSSG